MKKIIFIFSFLFSLSFVFAESVTLSQLRGKVDIKRPGKSWESAIEGVEIPINSMISTGFSSSAKVIMDNAELLLSPLTRMTIEEFVKQGSETKTKIFLGAGQVRADVKRSSGQTNRFEVRSPIATAAVRGTSFSFDGYQLKVIHGAVDFSNNNNHKRKVSVAAGNQSEVAVESTPTPPVQEKEEATIVKTAPLENEPVVTTSIPTGVSQKEQLDSAKAMGTKAPEPPVVIIEIN